MSKSKADLGIVANRAPSLGNLSQDFLILFYRSRQQDRIARIMNDVSTIIEGNFQGSKVFPESIILNNKNIFARISCWIYNQRILSIGLLVWRCLS